MFSENWTGLILRIMVPQFGETVGLHVNKVPMEKMGIFNTFGPVLINGRCIGYMLADDS